MSKMAKESGLPYCIIETEKIYEIVNGENKLLIEKTITKCGQ